MNHWISTFLSNQDLIYNKYKILYLNEKSKQSIVCMNKKRSVKNGKKEN